MANDKKFVVKRGLATPNVDFANGGGSISATFLSTSNTLSFSGNTGQLFSITDSMSGTIFSVNDISGIPSIEVIDTGSVKIAETFGTVAVGANTLSNYKFYVSGNTLLGNTTFNNSATITNNNRLAFNTLNGNSVYMIQQNDDNFVLYTTTPTGSSRAVFAVYANTNTSNLNIVIPLQISSTVVANSSTGSAGQVLTSSGSGVYWGAAGAGANNATYLNGRTWETAGAIGSTVANTGAFTTLTSSGVTRIGQSVAQADPSATDILSTAHVAIGGQGSNYLTFGQYSSFGQWIQSSFTNPTTASYNIALNPLGGNVSIGSATAPTKLYVNGHMSVANGFGIYANGTLGANGLVLTSNGTSLYWGSVSASGGGFTGNTVSANSTIVKNQSYAVNAAAGWVTMSLPSTVATGDIFIVHTYGGNTRILNNSINIMDIGTGNDLVLENGETVWLQAVNATSVDILFTYPAGGTPTMVANAVFATTANNSLFVYGKQEAQLSVAAAANATFATTSNNSLRFNGKQESQLSVANAVFADTANNSLRFNGKQEAQLSVASSANATFATTANNSLYAYGKQESQLSVASAVTVSGTVATSNNASFLNGRIWETAGAIGSTVANTGAFTTLTASANVNIDSGTLFVDGPSNRVGIGTTTPLTQLDVTGLQSLRAYGGGGTALGMYSYRGTAVSPTVVQAGDTLGALTFYGWDGDQDTLGSFIISTVEAGVGNNVMPSDLQFWTNQGSTLPSQRMTITGSGNVGIGNTTPGQRLQVDGSVGIKNALIANGVIGANGTVLTSNGSTIYWGTVSTGTVANATFATTANNALFANSASFVYGKQESQLSVSAANNSSFLAGRIWETAGAIGATVANTGAFTTLSARPNQTGAISGLEVSNNVVGIYLVPKAGPGAFNNLVANADNLIYFSNNTQNFGNLVIGTWTNRASGYGIRFTGGTYDVAVVSNTLTMTANTIINGNTFFNRGIHANNSIGANGLVLTSNGNGVFWGSVSAGGGTTTNAVTFNNGGAGDASGTTFNGSAARTISYNTLGAPSTTGTGASGSWGISVTGSSANSSALQGRTWQAPLGIGTVTANSGTFTTVITPNDVILGSDGNGWGRLVNASSALYIQAGSLNSGSATAQPIIFSNMFGGTERARIHASGGLSVGTASDPGTGAIYATGNITAYFSDKRLKRVISNIDNPLNKVSKLSGVYYTNNEVANKYGYNSTEMQVGVLAQEVEAILPEIVKPAPFDLDENNRSISGENYKTVQYDRLIPLLIEAIKELSNKVDSLEAMINKEDNNA